MRDTYRIADCDRHVIEPIDMWKEYLPAEFRDHAPYYEYLDRGEPLVDRIAFTAPEGIVPLPPDLMVDGESVLQLISARALREMEGPPIRDARSLLRGKVLKGTLESWMRMGSM